MRDDDPLKYFPGYAEACAKAEPNNLVPEAARPAAEFASDRSAQAMIEGQDTLMGTYEAMNKKIYDLLPTDPECQRLYMKWKREFRAIALTGRRESQAKMDEVSATYRELVMNLELEGIVLTPISESA